MKANSKEFTSVVGMFMLSGHKAIKINLKHSVGNIFKSKSDYVWFPGLQIIVHVNANMVTQLRQNDDGWFLRRNRKDKWCDVKEFSNGAEFEAMIAPHYTKFLNDMMMGEANVSNSERRSLQSGNCSQAT